MTQPSHFVNQRSQLPRAVIPMVFLLILHAPIAMGQQQDNRRRTEPGLVIETGARTATCDVLTFTPDGRYLLAAGDDKVVRVWPYGNGRLDKNARSLRWTIWREQRGSIYALALDKSGGRAAIAGYGAITGNVVILNLESEQIEMAMKSAQSPSCVIRALAFAPDGNRIAVGTESGEVWVWDISRNEAVRHSDAQPIEKVNRVRLLAFLNDDRLLSVAEDGIILKWNTADRRPQPPEVVGQFPATNDLLSLRCIAIDPKSAWLAAGTKQERGARTPNRIEFMSLHDQERRQSILLEEAEFVDSIAFDPSGSRLAVAVGSLARMSDGFATETGADVRLYDVGGDIPQLARRLPPCYAAEALAFHPNGTELAVAGGADHEVDLWDISARPKSKQTLVGPGRSLWGVGLSPDNRYVGFQSRRAENAKGVNHRGDGPWRVFDLQDRTWSSAEGFRPFEPVESVDDWHVVPAKGDASAWSVLGPDRSRYKLPLDYRRFLRPRCFTFLKSVGTKPVRLVVGHYYGASVFSCDEHGVRCTRVLVGHQGPVLALAVSEDQKWLLTASSDETIAAFSMEDWKAQPVLGARFINRDGKLFVSDVDIGGPAWTGDIREGDEVVHLRYRANRFLYDPESRIPKHEDFLSVGTLEETGQLLRQPGPGEELVLGLRSAADANSRLVVVAAMERPQWRFFPVGARDWVLWLGKSYFYDTSTEGDSNIGWHINAARISQSPSFSRAEQLRSRFHQPDVVRELLWVRDAKLSEGRLVDVEPPLVRIDSSAQTNEKGLRITVAVAAHNGNEPPQELEHLELWLDHFRFPPWRLDGWTTRKEIEIPRHRLRTGVNQITVQCFNKAGARGEASITIASPQQRLGQPVLYGLAVGIDDYSESRLSKDSFKPLQFARADAAAVRAAWLKQENKMYAQVSIEPLFNKHATREAIVTEIRKLKKKVRPDDHFLLFLSGHGYTDPKSPAGLNPDRFVFCCADFDPEHPTIGGVTSRDLYEELAELCCHKLVLLDVCHSGGVADPVRSLTPGGKGPTIFAACDKNEVSFEDNEAKHGLFTRAVLEALGEQFTDADEDGDGILDAAELFGYLRRRVPQMLAALDLAESKQHPIKFPSALDNVPLAKK